jgi:glycosyltransferase involved in cell wall biosynthesis
MVTPRYLPEMGGTEQHVRETSRRLARAGVEVTVLTTDPSGRLPAWERSDGVVVHRVRSWPRHRDFYLAPALHRDIVGGQWDLIHIQSYHTFVAPVAMLSALRSRTPYVLTFHGGGHSSRLRHRSRPLQRWALRPLLLRARRLICIASFEASDYARELRLPEELFAFIPNGMDPPGDQVSQPPIPGLIASVGRLERYKGHHRVLAAFPRVLEQEPDARLWIAGSGPYERKLRKLAQQLGVADKVEIRAIPPERRAAMLHELGRSPPGAG